MNETREFLLFCLQCGQSFTVTAPQAKTRRFCSTGCSRAFESRILQAKRSRLKPTRDVLIDLYVERKISTNKIAALYGVTRTSVSRWFDDDGIQMRPANSGITYRGGEPPTPKRLREFVHEQHLAYRDIGVIYGVSGSAIQHWMEKFDIPRPTTWETRRKGVHIPLPDEETLRDLYTVKMLALDAIADQYGVSEHAISKQCDAIGLVRRPTGFDASQRYICTDGDVVRSVYEQQVDNWLSAHSIDHLYEPKLPFGHGARADFLANGWHIEVWGVTNSEKYTVRRFRKVELYRHHGIPLLELKRSAFTNAAAGRWKRQLERVITTPPTPEDH